jgi:hypothetical protein
MHGARSGGWFGMFLAAHQIATIDFRDPKRVNHVPEQA